MGVECERQQEMRRCMHASRRLHQVENADRSLCVHASAIRVPCEYHASAMRVLYCVDARGRLLAVVGSNLVKIDKTSGFIMGWSSI